MRSPRVRRLASVFSLLSACLAAAADAPKGAAPDPATLPAPRRAVVPKLQGALTLDGDFNEPVWARAAVLGPAAQSRLLSNSAPRP